MSVIGFEYALELESGVVCNFHTLESYFVDLINGNASVYFRSYVSKKACEDGRPPVQSNSITASVKIDTNEVITPDYLYHQLPNYHVQFTNTPHDVAEKAKLVEDK
mgnify:CR=1 FL=1|jgi:hypothetical protein